MHCAQVLLPVRAGSGHREQRGIRRRPCLCELRAVGAGQALWLEEYFFNVIRLRGKRIGGRLVTGGEAERARGRERRGAVLAEAVAALEQDERSGGAVCGGASGAAAAGPRREDGGGHSGGK